MKLIILSLLALLTFLGALLGAAAILTYNPEESFRWGAKFIVALNAYEDLPTSVLEFLRDFVQVIHHAGHPTRESRADLREIKLELGLRRQEEEK